MTLKSQELHIQDKLGRMDKSNELRVNAQSDKFVGALRELKIVAKECHAFFC